MIRLFSSYRTRTPEETFAIASASISRFRISRITETTRLDRIGIPVYAGVRPGAVRGSMIVTAGKGLTQAEARVGALMEAIELAYSEPQNSALAVTWVKPVQILSIPGRGYDILDLCPEIDTEIPADEPIASVTAFDLMSNSQTYVPAELVFIPTPRGWPRYFGYHTNGLASGNTREEAILHGLLEVIERDVLSFDLISDSSRYVHLVDLPEPLAGIHIRLVDAGFELVLRETPNAFGLPFFRAYVVERSEYNPVYLSAGYGCHINPVIAAVRAVTEAIQSRMSYIHGGREDLEEHTRLYAELNFRERSRIVRESLEGIASREFCTYFPDIGHPQIEARSLPETLSCLLQHLRAHTCIQSVLCAFHTTEGEPLQVVKVIIPGLEFHNADSNRMGRRLHNFITHIADDHFRRTESQ